VPSPREFGAINLSSSDPIEHAGKGAIGALVIEPEGSWWQEGTTQSQYLLEAYPSQMQATVWTADGGHFREFVLLFQDDLNLRYGNGAPIEYLADAEDPEDTGQKGFNYRTEPLWFRMGFAPTTPLSTTRTFDFRRVLTNAQVGGDPETPLFQVEVGTPVRMRVLQPGGHARNHVFQMHGHIWEELPYIRNSSNLGSNPLSEWKGAQGMHGPTNHFDVMLKNGAGGRFGVLGDYLFRDQSSFMFDGGLWGIMRVLPRGALGSTYSPWPEPCVPEPGYDCILSSSTSTTPSTTTTNP
jgi:hypothetical protein